jgi:putative choline sulfate-utilization transcription factor
MSGPFTKVPPLRSLIAFEAAARRGKFSAAADELNMTQAAISQHIAHLEADVGTPLFDRQHRGVTLTTAGAAFLHSVELGLTELTEGAAAARRRSGTQTLHIRTDFGFAGWWLMPRMDALNKLMPNVEVRMTTSQAELAPADRDFDLGIIFGTSDWPRCRTTKLFDEEVYPICSPAYLSGRTLPLSPADIAEMRLLHLHVDKRQRWFDWADWMIAQGLPADAGGQGATFSNFQLVMQAVLMGQGVAIGFIPLIDDMVAAGQAVRLTDRPLKSERGYYLVEPEESVGNPLIQIVRDWLLSVRMAH